MLLLLVFGFSAVPEAGSLPVSAVVSAAPQAAVTSAKKAKDKSSKKPAAVSDGISAKAAALIEQGSGRLLYGKNETAQLPMASTTKIMTGLLAVESGRLDTVYTVPPEALRVEGSSMGLLPGEKITLRDLIYGLMLESGNDAANAIAICLAGSVENFVARMNERAAQLGLQNTHFVTPSGLDAAGHYTTALDLARLGAYAMSNAQFARIVSTQKIRVTYDGNANGRSLYNHNKMLSLYDGTVGIKTGFTKKCGRCLVSCATRNGVTLVVCTLNDPNDWKDHETLFDRGFAMLHTVPVAVSQPAIAEPVVGGVRNSVKVNIPLTVSAALKDGEALKITQKTEMPRFIYAPVQKGQVLGAVKLCVGDTVVARAELTASDAVAIQSAPAPGGFWHWLGGLFSQLFGGIRRK